MRLSAISERLLPSRAILALVPYATSDAAQLPVGRIARLALFQLSVGMAVVLLTGTLNRVMVLELAQPAWLVSVMVSLPLLFAPLRALIGFRSDNHRSLLGWRRVPFIWTGSMIQFGGLAIMPFALIVLAEPAAGPAWLGPTAAGVAFFLVGVGMHTTQTAGLALATDLASDENRPAVVSLLYVMLLIGTIGSALAFSLLLADFSYVRLIKIIQGAAVLTMVLNTIALWRQESLNPAQTDPRRARPGFRESWSLFIAEHRAKRLLLAIALGTAAFNMQDILLEPYGGEVLGMSVAGTTGLSAVWGSGMLIAFLLSARLLSRGSDPLRIAGYGIVWGLFAFAAVIVAAPVASKALFVTGAGLIGFGGGLFAIGTLAAAMKLGRKESKGLALGAWGAVQASAAGLAIALGGAARDVLGHMALAGSLGPTLNDPSVAYSMVYHFEILLLAAALIALGPIVGSARSSDHSFDLQDFPT
ncbi:MAG: BCD family MFS transporter [Pseudomonadota bacterium]